jgi:trimethylamine--corrinoid protein Co-methyltransferase
MTKAAITFLGGRERSHLHEETLRVLDEVGVAYLSPPALDILEEAGALVDRGTSIAHLPGELVERCLSSAPRRVTLAGRDPRHDLVLDEGTPLVCCSDGQGALVRDDLTGAVREATFADVRDAIRLCDALPEIDFLWTALTSPERDPRTVGLEVDALALLESGKHLQDVSPKTPAEVPYLLEMLEAAAGGSLWERPIYSLLDCAVAPLQRDPDSTDACLELCRHGVVVCPVSMPQMGTTAPVTPAGIAVVCMAELLSAVVLYQLASPGCAIVAEPMPGGSDMRNGRYLGGSPEVALANLMCVEMCRSYGLPTIGSGSTTDAQAPDYQAAAEGLLLWMSVALAGADGLVASSFVDSSAVFSPAKTVLDVDALGMLRRFLRETPVDASTTLFNDIAAVGDGGHFLGRASTRRLARAGEVWEPSLFRRGGSSWREGGDLVREAAERAAELVAAHRPEPLPGDVERAIGDAVRRYAASLGV